MNLEPISDVKTPLDDAQEKARFQGVGDNEYFRYGMNSLTDAQLSDLAGNSCLQFAVAGFG